MSFSGNEANYAPLAGITLKQRSHIAQLSSPRPCKLLEIEKRNCE